MDRTKYTKIVRQVLMICFFNLLAIKVFSSDKLLDIITSELQREFNELKKEDTPPYYIEYRVSEIKSYGVSSSFGSLLGNVENKRRLVNIVVKVGDYGFDNTHIFKTNEEDATSYNYNYSAILPVEDDETAIKQTLWWYTNKAYLNSLSIYNAIKQKNKEDKKEQNKLSDFSKEDVSVYFEPAITDLGYDEQKWIKTVKEITHPFLNDTSVFKAEASFNYVIERKYFVSTEGSSVVQNVSYCQLSIMTNTRSSDRNVIPFLKTYVAKDPSGIPSREEIMKDINNIEELMAEYKNCPTAEPFTGPAILSPSAAGVFFHEIFGHRIEGHRLKDESDAQTFKEKIGSRVLPKTFNVYFDPTVKNFKNIDLIGNYAYDDQGVKSERVDIVKEGELKGFLMSRLPVEGFGSSNGHGRAQTGYLPVARQSNMFVSSNDPLSENDLRKMLIRECKKQNKEYGYFFKSVYGGFTSTTRYTPNVFNIFPIEVYRIYVDGRPDELVRGVQLIGTPLSMFAEITAAGDEYSVFNGFCGAESGMVPVSTIAPSVFVKKIETQSQPNFYVNMPILKRPDLEEESVKNIGK